MKYILKIESNDQQDVFSYLKIRHNTILVGRASSSKSQLEIISIKNKNKMPKISKRIQKFASSEIIKILKKKKNEIVCCGWNYELTLFNYCKGSLIK